MEMCIAIRTLLQHGRRISVQAGAGLVYDSKPAAEYRETVNKARACFAAVAQAQTGDLDARPGGGGPPPAPRTAAPPSARAERGAKRRVEARTHAKKRAGGRS